MELHGATVLVTGGAGNIGSHVVDALIEEGAQVTVYDAFVSGRRANLAWALQNGALRVIEGNICDLVLLKKACRDVDYIFHLAAAQQLPCFDTPRLALEVNVAGTFNVLEAAVAASVQKVIFSSAGAVYGDPLYVPVHEDHPLNPTSVYAASKIAGEKFCEAFFWAYGLPYVALRYWNVYGPRVDARGNSRQVIPKWLDLIEQGRPPVIYGDGSQTMDLVYVTDVARANILACSSHVSHDVFNVGTGLATTVKELATILLEMMGSPLKPAHQPFQEDKRHVKRRQASTKKAERLLGFKSTIALYDGLRSVIEWRKQNEVLCDQGLDSRCGAGDPLVSNCQGHPQADGSH